MNFYNFQVKVIIGDCMCNVKRTIFFLIHKDYKHVLQFK